MQLKPKTSRNPTAQRLLLYVFLWDFLILGTAGLLEFTPLLSGLPTPLAGLFGLDGLDGLIGWSLLVSLFGTGAACIMLGVKSRNLGWWLAGLGFALLSLDKLALLGERLGSLWSPALLGENPWSLAWPLGALLSLLLALRSIRKTTEETPGLRRCLLWAAALWGMAHVLEASVPSLAQSELRFGGLAVDRLATLGDASLGLVAALLCIYSVVSLIEYEERRRRLQERASLRSWAKPGSPRQAA